MSRGARADTPAVPDQRPSRPLRYTDAYSSVHHLADGTAVRLRLLRPDDRDWLLAGFDHLSPESRYLRFFSTTPRLSAAALGRLLSVDGWNHLAVAAEVVTEGPERGEGFGVARFIRLPEEPDTAEAAVVVVDHMQRRGLGKLLLSVLAAAARERGITTFRAEVLRTNEGVKALLHELDDHAKPASVDGAVAVYLIDLPDAPPPENMDGPLFRLLKMAASGLQVLLRRFEAG